MLSGSQRKTIRRMYADGSSYGQISEAVEASEYMVRCLLHPSYAEMQRNRARDRRKDKKDPRKYKMEERNAAIDTSNRVKVSELPPIPPDTRDLTARLMGDPLVGRRAIDMRTD